MTNGPVIERALAESFRAAMKKIMLPLLLAVSLLLTACGAQSGGEEAPWQDAYQTDPVPAGKPQPVEPEDAQVDENTSYTCTVSISCAALLDNMDKLAQNKRPLVPADGVLLPETQVTFSAGESAFDVLQRVCRDNKLHMESSFTLLYNSAYIEGIGNLYEFDAGSLSGWMYAVNDWFPNYGCSRYQLNHCARLSWTGGRSLSTPLAEVPNFPDGKPVHFYTFSVWRGSV